MIRKQVTIINKLGLHARAAAKLVTCASRFQSQILLERNGQRVNGKSIMGVMMLAASQGTELTLELDGADAEPALEALEALIAERFGEAE
jgi:phosphocarrier protein